MAELVAEEQKMESVALESIFGDDFQVKYSSPLCWSIRISPHSTGEGVENHGSIWFDPYLLSGRFYESNFMLYKRNS